MTAGFDVIVVGGGPAGSTAGAPLRLRHVATVTEGLAPPSIERENQNRLVRSTASVLPATWSVGEATAAARESLDGFPLPDSYRVLFGGQEEAIAANRRTLLSAIALAVFMVFAVMAVQYESLVDPLVIMAAILLGLGARSQGLGPSRDSGPP